MTPRSLTALAALLALVSAPAGAVMCLKPGSFGPDVPNCTPYLAAGGAKGALGSAETAIGDNLLALAGDASAERFNERTALDVAGTPQPAPKTPAKSKTSQGARPTDGVASAPGSLGAPGLGDPKTEDYEAIAGEIVKGTGNAFQGIEAQQPRSPAAQTAAQAAAQAAGTTPGRSTGMNTPPARNGGMLGASLSDPGRSMFDKGSSALPDDVPSPGAGATVQQCTIIHPCAHAN